MNSIGEKRISTKEIRDLVAEWISAYKSAIVSYLSAKIDGKNVIICARVIFQIENHDLKEKGFFLETENILAGKEYIDKDQSLFDKLLTNLSNGFIQTVAGKHILVQENSGYSTYLYSICHPLANPQVRLPTLFVRGASISSIPIMNKDRKIVDMELKSASLPFDSLDELIRECEVPGQLGDYTRVEVLVKTPGVISSESFIDSENIVFRVDLSNELDTSCIQLGYRAFTDGGINRQVVNGNDMQWESDNLFFKGTYKIPVSSIKIIDAFLSYKNEFLHQAWIIDPEKRLNSDLAIHEVFDPELKILTKMLISPSKNRDYEFENAVSVLASLLGFYVNSYGHISKLQDGPDLLIKTQTGNTGVVECTVGHLDNKDKLSKLVIRTEKIKQSMQVQGITGNYIQPIIVSPLSRNELAADLEKAGKHNIAVLCKENITAMLAQVKLPQDSERRFNELRSFIPGSGEEEPGRSF